MDADDVLSLAVDRQTLPTLIECSDGNIICYNGHVCLKSNNMQVGPKFIEISGGLSNNSILIHMNYNIKEKEEPKCYDFC